MVGRCYRLERAPQSIVTATSVGVLPPVTVTGDVIDSVLKLLEVHRITER